MEVSLCIGERTRRSLAFAAAPATASTGSFAGIWRATDPSDGSTLVLAIGPGNHVLLLDNSAASCGGGFAFAYGPGVASEETLSAALDVFCGLRLVARDVEVRFQRSGESLVGPGGEVYTRVRLR